MVLAMSAVAAANGVDVSAEAGAANYMILLLGASAVVAALITSGAFLFSSLVLACFPPLPPAMRAPASGPSLDNLAQIARSGTFTEDVILRFKKTRSVELAAAVAPRNPRGLAVADYTAVAVAAPRIDERGAGGSDDDEDDSDGAEDPISFGGRWEEEAEAAPRSVADR